MIGVRPQFTGFRMFALRTAPLAVWYRNHVTRRALRQLGHDRLRDLGLTREQARHEAAKWFWRL